MKELINQYLAAEVRAGNNDPSWFRNGPTEEVVVSEDNIDIKLDGPIDQFVGVDVTPFVDAINSNPGKDVTLNISTPGGSLFDGLKLYGALSERAKTNNVEIQGNGLVASAGALIFLAADKENRHLNDGTMVMIHGTQAGVVFYGNKDDLKKESERLYDAMSANDENLKNIVREKTGLDEQIVAEWVEGEKYLTKQDAIENNIASEDKPVARATETTPENNEQIKEYLMTLRDRFYKKENNE